MNEMTDDGLVVGEKFSFAGFWKWPLKLITSPASYYQSLAKGGGYGTPILFAYLWLLLVGVVEIIVMNVRPMDGIRPGMVENATAFIVWPIFLLAMGFVGSAVLFVVWHLMGSKENYQTAFRFWAFTMPVVGYLGALLSFVPYLNVLAFLYAVFLVITASLHLHGLPFKRSLIVWLSIAAGTVALVTVSALLSQSMQRRGLTAASAGNFEDFSDDEFTDEEDYEDLASTAPARTPVAPSPAPKTKP